MSEISHVHEKTLQDLVVEFLEIKTGDTISSVDLPPDVTDKIEELTDLLEEFYGNINLYYTF